MGPKISEILGKRIASVEDDGYGLLLRDEAGREILRIRRQADVHGVMRHSAEGPACTPFDYSELCDLPPKYRLAIRSV